MVTDFQIAVVIPCYKVKEHILEVISKIGSEVSKIYIIDDKCPDKSGELVQQKSSDLRVRVLFHEWNQGVGGAVISGYQAALNDGADIIIKLDGDGQMPPDRIPKLIAPIMAGNADYTKGTRFDNLEDLLTMPRIRIFGNAILSIFSKFSSGYWSINDPTNGFTAIHRRALERVSLMKLSRTFFFESDMLFRLSLCHAVVRDVAFPAVYGIEKSSLKLYRVLFEFPWKHLKNISKRYFYKYFLREWSIATFELPIGFALVLWGTWFGLTNSQAAAVLDRAVTAGQVTVASLAILVGVQLLLSFISFDIRNEPSQVNREI